MKGYSKKILFSILLIFTLGVTVYYYIFFDKKNNQPSTNGVIATQSLCLKENEIADYNINREERLLKIVIKDKITNRELSIFEIKKVSKSYHGFELHKCKAYAIKVVNFDDKKGVPLPDYRTELWQFYYNGEGKLLLTLFKEEGSPDNLSQDFRIDPTETYIVLERSYLENPNYALIFKNLNNIEEDAFILLYGDLISKYPELKGADFGLNTWTKNGKYLWARLFSGANVSAFIRIERDTWKVDVFPAPKGTRGGDALNPEFGYITYDTGIPWAGIDVITKELEKEWWQTGKKNNLYLYNLFTKKQILLETSDDPAWFSPRWISDTELEYYIPSEGKKVYRIQK